MNSQVARCHSGQRLFYRAGGLPRFYTAKTHSGRLRPTKVLGSNRRATLSKARLAGACVFGSPARRQ